MPWEWDGKGMSSLDYQARWPRAMPALGSIQKMKDPSGERAQRQAAEHGAPSHRPDAWGGGPAYGVPLWSLEKRRPKEEERQKECERRAAEDNVPVWQMEQEMEEDDQMEEWMARISGCRPCGEGEEVGGWNTVQPKRKATIRTQKALKAEPGQSNIGANRLEAITPEDEEGDEEQQSTMQDEDKAKKETQKVSKDKA